MTAQCHSRFAFCFLLLLLCSQIAYAAPVNDAVRWERFTLKDGHIQFPVLINGVAANAIIDTGAEVNCVSERFVAQHGDDLRFGGTMRIKGVYGTEEKRLVQQLPVTLFGAELKLYDLAPIAMGSADLLLGRSFFDKLVLQVDYPNQRLRILKRDWVDMDQLANVELRQEKNNTLPAIKVSFGGAGDAWLTLDTGNANDLLLRRSFAEARGWLQGPVSSGKSSGATRHQADVESFTVPYLKVGPFELEQVPATVPAEGEQLLVGQRDGGRALSSGARVVGLLGYDVLKHFVLTLDSKRYKAHLGLPETISESSGVGATTSPNNTLETDQNPSQQSQIN